MTTSSNCTQRRKRGISLSSRLNDNENLKDLREHHTTVQSSFIREPRPSSVSFIYQRPQPIKMQGHIISVPKSISLPKKITFKYTNKSQNFVAQIFHPIRKSEPNILQQQIRYLINPQSSRIKVSNYEVIDTINRQQINPSLGLSHRFNPIQSNYVSPYKNLITPLRVQSSAIKIINTNNQNRQRQLLILPLNSELSKIRQFKMQEESYCQVNNQTKTDIKQLSKEEQQPIINVNVNVMNKNKNKHESFLQTNPIRYTNDLTSAGNPQIISQTIISEDTILKEKTWNSNNLNNNLNCQSVKVQQKLINKKPEKIKGRMNHLRIKEVQKRLEQIIKVCDSNLL